VQQEVDKRYRPHRKPFAVWLSGGQWMGRQINEISEYEPNPARLKRIISLLWCC
jgi:hypothetical protein